MVLRLSAKVQEQFLVQRMWALWVQRRLSLHSAMAQYQIWAELLWLLWKQKGLDLRQTQNQEPLANTMAWTSHYQHLMLEELLWPLLMERGSARHSAAGQC